MRLSLEEKRIAHTLWLRYFVMLSSSELLCNRMTQRDTETVGGGLKRVGAFFCGFQWIHKCLMLWQSEHEEGDVQRQCYLELQGIYLLLVLLELAVCGLCFSVCD